MEIINSYQLEISLESLHFETKEWLEEVQFYLCELRLFNTMITHKKTRNALEEQIIADVMINIRAVMDEISEKIIKDLSAHEKYLSGIFLNSIDVNVKEYRQKHKCIESQIRSLQKKIYFLKTRVYYIFKKEQFIYRHNYTKN